MALAVARRGYVLELGRTVMQGTPADLSSNEQLTAAYLGQA
jgi:ABC-type branched-subunit amino acid transport system ATPase component